MKIKYKLNLGLAAVIIAAAAFINCIRISRGEAETVMYEKSPAYIAIVIDDFGGFGEGREEFFKLPVKFTGAVMPFMENSKTDAARLISGGNEVIVHLPMEAKTGKRSWLGERPLLTGMTDEEIKKLLEDALSEDCAAGINNHMGSKVAEDERVMSLIFKVLSEKNLIFIDSMTTPDSLGEVMGKKYKVPVIKRDVFLDSTDSKEEIIKNLEKTKEIALKRGYALCIGHVGAEGGLVTLRAITETYKDLQNSGIKFVTVSELKDIIYGN